MPLTIRIEAVSGAFLVSGCGPSEWWSTGAKARTDAEERQRQYGGPESASIVITETAQRLIDEQAVTHQEGHQP